MINSGKISQQHWNSEPKYDSYLQFITLLVVPMTKVEEFSVR